ncbi:hypothetical protein DM558_03400 [Entomomonas moraniae]|uniref:Uncharacterized protein n=1 Tax=Entomomonas moraniae TaxID=2213226 RepID=A0A3Q9JLS1_9GAMM|nr:hypothetical protein [Entomomonas moraniae]AZS49883.1 hypothetical protein DM558_03400 [Entomomonas moraniae]
MSEEFAIIQNLKDAGCDEVLIKSYLTLKAKDYTDEQLRLLACHRCNLMTELHGNQKKIDRLDYLIYFIKKSISTENRLGDLP